MELHTLMREPWEVSDKPYMLHAAYALSCLYDALSGGDEDEKFDIDDIWGCTVPKKIFDRLVADIASDFNDAVENRKPVKIWGKSYSIRRVNAYDRKRLCAIFDFELQGGEYVISRNGVMNLHGAVPDSLKRYEVTKENMKRNRTYLRQIIRLAEDDANDGWDKLTDMEIVLYCWALFYNKHQSDNLKRFLEEYKEYVYVDTDDIPKCYNEKSAFRQCPVGMYSFSYERVQEWNVANRQTSEAAAIPQEEADDYWYETALKGTFKPIDEK